MPADQSLRSDRYGPGCERHKGDPHNLCQACWDEEPEPLPLPEKRTGFAATDPNRRTNRA